VAAAGLALSALGGPHPRRRRHRRARHLRLLPLGLPAGGRARPGRTGRPGHPRRPDRLRPRGRTPGSPPAGAWRTPRAIRSRTTRSTPGSTTSPGSTPRSAGCCPRCPAA
jgi:hypothetical protein